jgi:hypothetical protein
MSLSSSRPFRIAALATLLTVFSSPQRCAEAAFIFSNRTDFEAALATPAWQTLFEGFENADVDNPFGPRTLSFDAFDVEYDGFSEFGVLAGSFPNEGSRRLVATFQTPGAVSTGSGQPPADADPDTLTFAFDSPVSAFGVDLRDTELGRVVYLIEGATGGTAAARGGNNNLQFFGIIPEAPLDSISFEMRFQVGGSDGVIFDNVLLAQPAVPVPEPSSLCLLGIGAAGLVLRGRRRRSAWNTGSLV